MFKKILLIFILSVGIVFSTFAKELNSQTIHSTYGKKVYAHDKLICSSLEQYCVSLYSVDPGVGKCSGVVISKSQECVYILTAKHCVSLNEETYAEAYKVEYAITSSDDDLAILVISGNIKNKEAAKLSSSKGSKNDRIYLIGYPSFTSTYVSIGKIIQYSDDWGWAHLKIKPGCSGGGVFNEQEELIGIIWGGMSKQDISVFESILDIKEFLGTVGLL